MSFAAVQKHVAVLERAGLVTKERNGREQLVRTDPEAVRRARRALDLLEAAWRDRVDRMADLLAGYEPETPTREDKRSVHERPAPELLPQDVGIANCPGSHSHQSRSNRSIYHLRIRGGQQRLSHSGCVRAAGLRPSTADAGHPRGAISPRRPPRSRPTGQGGSSDVSLHANRP